MRVKYTIFINLPVGDKGIETPWKYTPPYYSDQEQEFKVGDEYEVKNLLIPKMKIPNPKFPDYRIQDETEKFDLATKVQDIRNALNGSNKEVEIYLHPVNLSDEISERTKTFTCEEVIKDTPF